MLSGEEFRRKQTKKKTLLELRFLHENCGGLLPDPRRVYKSVVFARV